MNKIFVISIIIPNYIDIFDIIFAQTWLTKSWLTKFIILINNKDEEIVYYKKTKVCSKLQERDNIMI